ncbi:MAG TPA: hypothetical protein VMM18_06510 [Gemmatimonadaceae bacterium]|nr:hypothetical protein [Gemmatimonadaceae bacterium]
MAEITREKAERIARAHACENCEEYSYKRLVIKPSTAAHREEFQEVWHVEKTCGVCGLQQEMGIDGEGEIVYVA